MAKQYRLCRKIASVPVTASGFATIDLPRSYDYEALFLRINGSIVVSTGATSVRAEAPCQVVPRITVIADGKNNIFNAPFWYASNGKIDRPLNHAGARNMTPPTAASAATYAVEAIGVVDFATVDGVRAKDSNFRTSKLSLFQLQMQFGAALDSFVPGAGVATFSNMFVDVFSSEMVEMPNVDGSITTPFALKKVSFQEIAVPASNANQEIRLPAGNMLRSVVVRTEGSTTAGEPATAILNNLQLVSGVDVRMNISGANLRAKNNADTGQYPVGYYSADVCALSENAVNLTDLWDLSGQTEPKLILDVTGGTNNKLQAVVTEYILAAV